MGHETLIRAPFRALTLGVGRIFQVDEDGLAPAVPVVVERAKGNHLCSAPDAPDTGAIPAGH